MKAYHSRAAEIGARHFNWYASGKQALFEFIEDCFVDAKMVQLPWGSVTSGHNYSTGVNQSFKNACNVVHLQALS